ncbi:MAG TPA: right-handed parallel beta-helix repeat-containing protein [Candidatus Acidoferrum sp.]|nr:right-handed parallel beta-helix repeat-containing protein [Candidatus Acidoferrum sp.]
MTRTTGGWPRALLAAPMVILASLSAQQVMEGSVVEVGNCVPNIVQFTTIQGAVNAVPPGSIIKICPANYPEQVVVNKNLTLTGVKSGTTDNPVLVIPSGGFVPNTTSLTSGHPIAAQILVQSPATAVTISNLAVDGSNNNLNSGCGDARLIGIYYQNASGTVSFVTARNQAQDAANFGCQDSAGLGIFVQSASPSTSTVRIQNTTVRGYQKNGITGNEVGTTVTIAGNSVVGEGPTTTAQNGIQVGFGATGKVQNNTVADDDFNADPSAGTGSGILIFDSSNMTITANFLTNVQNGIPIVTDGTMPADNNTVANNHVSNTHLGDGIDLCSNGSSVTGNVVFSSGQAGIHLDSSCGSTGNNNTVSKNTVNEACAGILLGSGTGNTFPLPNLVANVANTSLAGDVCTPTVLSQRRVGSEGHNSRPARP